MVIDGGVIAVNNLTGFHRISGTVDKLGDVGIYRVVLFRRDYNYFAVKLAVSNSDGYYCFNNIAFSNSNYFCIAFDNGATPLNAAIADFVTPEPMP